MTFNQIIEKYNGSNFEGYIKENATIDYWNELIKIYKIDKLSLSDYDSFLVRFICVHKESGIPFDGYCERQIKILEIQSESTFNINDASKTKKAKDYKDFIWFKTGLKLATGEAYDLYNKYKLDKGHFAKICFELGFKETDRTYFSSTINDNETDKNTFTDKNKLQKLHKHLTENNLPFGTEFLEKYNQIETE